MKDDPMISAISTSAVYDPKTLTVQESDKGKPVRTNLGKGWFHMEVFLFVSILKSFYSQFGNSLSHWMHLSVEI